MATQFDVTKSRTLQDVLNARRVGEREHAGLFRSGYRHGTARQERFGCLHSGRYVSVLSWGPTAQERYSTGWFQCRSKVGEGGDWSAEEHNAQARINMIESDRFKRIGRCVRGQPDLRKSSLDNAFFVC